MSIDTYSVSIDGVKVAEHMSLTYALLLIKAMMQEYYNEPDIEVTITREMKEEIAP